MYQFLQKRLLMPNIDEKLTALKDSLSRGVSSVLPSRGIPGKGGNNSVSSLTTWTQLEIYPNGAPRSKNTVVANWGDKGATWVLPLPQDLTDIHSLQYETIEFGAIAMATAALGQGNNTVGVLDAMGVGKSASGDALSKEFGGGIAGFAEGPVAEEVLGFFGLDQAINVVRSRRRNTTNPNMENMFKTSNLRTFQFSWALNPLSSEDANSIKNFINEMKKSIYPLNGTVGGAWNRLQFPAEFIFTFYSTGVGTGPKVIFRTVACACTDFTVAYTPNGAFHTHVDGNPTTVNISGTFQELYTIDQTIVEQLAQ